MSEDSTSAPQTNDDMQSPPLTFAEYQKMPDWKKELLQKRKYISKVTGVADGSMSASKSFDDGKPPHLL